MWRVLTVLVLLAAVSGAALPRALGPTSVHSIAGQLGQLATLDGAVGQRDGRTGDSVGEPGASSGSPPGPPPGPPPLAVDWSLSLVAFARSLAEPVVVVIQVDAPPVRAAWTLRDQRRVIVRFRPCVPKLDPAPLAA